MSYNHPIWKDIIAVLIVLLVSFVGIPIVVMGVLWLLGLAMLGWQEMIGWIF